MSDWRDGRNWFSWLPPFGAWNSGVYTHPRPTDHQFVYAMRDGWEKPQIINPRDLHPLVNAADLYWSPWDGRTLEQWPSGSTNPQEVRQIKANILK